MFLWSAIQFLGDDDDDDDDDDDEQQQRDESLVCKDIPVHGKYLTSLQGY